MPVAKLRGRVASVPVMVAVAARADPGPAGVKDAQVGAIHVDRHPHHRHPQISTLALIFQPAVPNLAEAWMI
jgi:hypothetical protein